MPNLLRIKNFGQAPAPATNRPPSRKTSETIPTNRRIPFRRALEQDGSRQRIQALPVSDPAPEEVIVH
jgi:hypothetical protein